MLIRNRKNRNAKSWIRDTFYLEMHTKEKRFAWPHIMWLKTWFYGNTLSTYSTVY